MSVPHLERANEVAIGRERIYYPMALTFIIVQAVFYLLVIGALGLLHARLRWPGFVRVVVLTFAAWPLATYLVRMWPWLMTLGHVDAPARVGARRR